MNSGKIKKNTGWFNKTSSSQKGISRSRFLGLENLLLHTSAKLLADEEGTVLPRFVGVRTSWCSHWGFLSTNSLTVSLSWCWGRCKGCSVCSGCSWSHGHCLTDPTQNSRSAYFFSSIFWLSLVEITHLPWGVPEAGSSCSSCSRFNGHGEGWKCTHGWYHV